MLGIAVLTATTMVVPMYNNASDNLLKVESKKKELESVTNKVTILSKLDPEVLKERVRVLDSALPPRKDVLLYLASIDGLSKDLGLSFGGISLSPGEIGDASESAKTNVAKTNGLQTLETEIKLSGNKEAVYVFLRTIETVLPLMQIRNIKVTILGADDYALTLTLAMLWADPAVSDVKGQVSLFGTEEDEYFNQLSQYKSYKLGGNMLQQIDQPSTPKADLFAPYTAPVIIPLQ